MWRKSLKAEVCSAASPAALAGQALETRVAAVGSSAAFVVVDVEAAVEAAGFLESSVACGGILWACEVMLLMWSPDLIPDPD